MSAYICNPEHIRELAAFAADRFAPYPGGGHRNVPESALRYSGGPDLSGHDDAAIATAFADILWQENIRSVRYRYPDDTWGSLPGPCVKPLHVVVRSADLYHRKVRDPVHILKMCDGLEYQSCECPDYRQTPAYALLQHIRKAAISQLPGYEDGPWAYEEAA